MFFFVSSLMMAKEKNRDAFRCFFFIFCWMSLYFLDFSHIPSHSSISSISLISSFVHRLQSSSCLIFHSKLPVTITISQSSQISNSAKHTQPVCDLSLCVWCLWNFYCTIEWWYIEEGRQNTGRQFNDSIFSYRINQKYFVMIMMVAVVVGWWY